MTGRRGHDAQRRRCRRDQNDQQMTDERPRDYVTIVLPEFVPARWWHHLFHNQRALLIKGALLFKPNTVVTSVPFHLRH